jgi:hypothetical protein
MPTSRVTDMLRAKHAAFFIAALTISLAMESRSAEVIPQKPDRYFNDSAGVVSKEAAYRFNEELAQFEPFTSNRLKDRIDSSRDSAFVGAILKVRLDDRGPGETVPQQDRGGASAETPIKPTTVTVFSTAAPRKEHESATPGRITPDPDGPGKTVPEEARRGGPSPWFFIIFVIALIVIVIALIVIVIALIVISRILRRERSQKKKLPSYPLRIAIKFNSRGGKPPPQLDGWQASLGGTAKALPPLRLLPFFESLNSNLLSELVDRALENNPGYKPPDLLAWFQVETPAGVNADELVKPLRKLNYVETAYVMRPVPPPVGSTDDPLNALQGYEDAAPNGIDARYAWGFAGGDGVGIGFVDLEQGWNLNHQDLKSAEITIISGKNCIDHSHGTSVLGQVLMVDNTKGGVGIAPAAQGRVISQWRTPSSYNTADAIAHAAANMSFGDVLLLEAQENDPDRVGDETLWPVEIADATYDAISLATAAGIVVVEAGANGGQDLDTYNNASGQKIFDRSSAGFRDSGAIMVGAASSAAPHRRLGFSNYGNRIDCYAWGENIETTTTNLKGTINTMYRTDFKGTSGASPIVAGAALILQGIRQAALDRGGRGKRFNSRELRDLLTANGTLSKTPATDKIGVMPDLRAIITQNPGELTPAPIPTSGPS